MITRRASIALLSRGTGAGAARAVAVDARGSLRLAANANQDLIGAALRHGHARQARAVGNLIIGAVGSVTRKCCRSRRGRGGRGGSRR